MEPISTRMDTPKNHLESSSLTLKTQDGIQLFAQFWKLHNPVAVVVQSHGLGDHSGRYAHVAEFFAHYGIALLAFDHRGHGKSQGKRGHIPNYEAMMEELDLMLGEAEKLFPGIPKFIYGHSWGGNIALNYLIRRQPSVAGAIVTGPWLRIPKVPAIQESMARVVNGLIPGLTQDNKINTSWISRDAAVVKAYEKDPLVHRNISVRLFVDSDAAAKYALEHAGEVNVPLLLMHGGADKITLPEGSQEFSKGMKANGVFKLWDGLFHEVHNEPEKVEVLKMMVEFMLRVMGRDMNAV
jgi:alpha-beta hydrolase superfamily lysophospholipase